MKTIHLLICLLLITTLSHAGVDFTMSGTKIPDFTDRQEAVLFGVHYNGNQIVDDKIIQKRDMLRGEYNRLAGKEQTSQVRKEVTENLQQQEILDQALQFLRDKSLAPLKAMLDARDKGMFGSIMYAGSRTVTRAESIKFRINKALKL